MTPADIRQLLAFNRWAHRAVLDTAAQLTAEQLAQDLGSSFASVRDTLVHLLSAEWLWAERWRGVSPRRRLDPADFPDLGSIRARWVEVERAQDAFLAGLAEDDLAATFRYVNPQGVPWEYPLWQVVAQLVTHACYHRGQVTTMLRQLGALPVETDFLTYYDVGGGPAPQGHPGVGGLGELAAGSLASL